MPHLSIRHAMGMVAIALALIGGAILLPRLHHWSGREVSATEAEVSPAQRARAFKHCMAGVQLFVDVHWANACEATARIQTVEYGNCLRDRTFAETPGLAERLCAESYRYRDASIECDLPEPVAQSMDRLYMREQKRCELAAGRPDR